MALLVVLVTKAQTTTENAASMRKRRTIANWMPTLGMPVVSSIVSSKDATHAPALTTRDEMEALRAQAGARGRCGWLSRWQGGSGAAAHAGRPHGSHAGR